MKWFDLANKCEKELKLLVKKGELICDKFELPNTASTMCKNCGYSQYYHLCKQLVECED